jgi:transposase
MKEETITLNTQEQKRAMVLNRIQAGQFSVAEAAEVLDLSARHMRRILAAYEKEGPAALAHGNRGRKPAHSISAAVRAQVVDLARTTYQGCNQQHLRDRLARTGGHHALAFVGATDRGASGTGGATTAQTARVSATARTLPAGGDAAAD